MAACGNCGWETAPELIRHGLCLVCGEYLWQHGVPRPPPEDLDHLHRGETWPCVADPRVRKLVEMARLFL